MKNRIFTLIIAAAMVATSPVFAMEPEQDPNSIIHKTPNIDSETFTATVGEIISYRNGPHKPLCTVGKHPFLIGTGNYELKECWLKGLSHTDDAESLESLDQNASVVFSSDQNNPDTFSAFVAIYADPELHIKMNLKFDEQLRDDLAALWSFEVSQVFPK